MMYRIKILQILGLLIFACGYGSAQDVVGEMNYYGNNRISDNHIESWSGLKEGSPLTENLVAVANQKIIKG